jgi:hypothetical protein
MRAKLKRRFIVRPHPVASKDRARQGVDWNLENRSIAVRSIREIGAGLYQACSAREFLNGKKGLLCCKEAG